MANLKVAPATKKTKNVPKRRREALPQSAAEDETSQDPGSSFGDHSDSDSTYMNEDGELEIEKVQKRMKDVQQTLESNKRVAAKFQDHVLSRKEEILKTIEQHKEQMNDDQIRFERLMHCAIVSALLPMSTTLDPNLDSGKEDESARTKISVSAAARTNAELFDRAEEIGKTTTALLACYSKLRKLGTQERRIIKTRQLFQTDKDLSHKLITAGATKARLRVQAMLANRSISAQLIPGMSKDEDGYATRFENRKGAETGASEQYSAHWDTFARNLTDAVREIEEIVDHE